MNSLYDIPPLATSIVALCFLFRTRNRSYFFDTGFFMLLANIGFLLLVLQNLVSDIDNMSPSGIVDFSLIFLMALTIGIASYLSPKDQLQLFTHRILSRGFVLFTIFLTFWITVTLVLVPWNIVQIQTSDGVGFYFTYDTWYMVFSLLLLVFFITLPVRSFYGKAKKIVDREAARSVRIISTCWALFGVSIFLEIYLTRFAILTVQTGTSVFDSILFLLIALALKEPSVMGRIITPENYISSTLPKYRSESSSILTSLTTSPSQPKFSLMLNMKHENLEGNRILLEYEPTATYEMLIQNFVEEFQSYGASVAIFTSVGSPIYRLALAEPNLRIFGFSTKTSNPAKISDQTVLLPERDASLLLDALDKLVKAYTGHRIAIVFDVFTDLILSQGFEKVYSPLSTVVELAESSGITTIFTINEAAMEKRALNGIRGLFRFQLHYDMNGLMKMVDSPVIRQFGQEYSGHEDASLDFSTDSNIGEGELEI